MLEPSIMDSKFSNARFNQIGENLSDGVVEAITTIARAPLPYVPTTTVATTTRYPQTLGRIKNSYRGTLAFEDSTADPPPYSKLTKRIGTGVATSKIFNYVIK